MLALPPLLAEVCVVKRERWVDPGGMAWASSSEPVAQLCAACCALRNFHEHLTTADVMRGNSL